MRYMRVPLTEISKGKYYSTRSNAILDAERPLGYILTMNGQRVLFIAVDGKFYMGNLMPWQSNEMFMQMQFNEIKAFTAAQFEQPETV